MKIIEQSYEILTETDPYKLIELAGRTCYKSESKITEDSAKGFVRRLFKREHDAILEFGYACFEVSDGHYSFIQTSGKDKYLNTDSNNRCIVSGNFRAWLEFFINTTIGEMPEPTTQGLHNIGSYLSTEYPEIFGFLPTNFSPIKPLLEEDMGRFEKQTHATRIVRFITNRGVIYELIRHRPCSFAQESTRYVKYDGNMEFIKPVWCSDQVLGVHTINWVNLFGTRLEGQINPELPPAENVWFWNQAIAERDYCNLLDCGWRAEQAREVLPNSLKTEIVVKATTQEWNHIFKLRCAKTAHPQIRALMKPLQTEFQIKEPELFGKLERRV